MYSEAEVAFIATFFLFGLIHSPSIFILHAILIIIYLLLSMFYSNTKNKSLKQKILMSSYDPPKIGRMVCKTQFKVSKAQEYAEKLNKIPDNPRVTLTHIIIKGITEAFKASPSTPSTVKFCK